MTETASLLFANEAFYLVFRNRDVASMDALWAPGPEVSCIHPGWDALENRDEVMTSWRAILGNPESPSDACRGARARVIGGTGLVVCYEIVGQSVLVATNVFVKDGAGWKMVHHQAGPCRVTPEKLAREPEPGALQ